MAVVAPHDNGAPIDMWEVSYREFVEPDEYDVDSEEEREELAREDGIDPHSPESQVRFPWTISDGACQAFHVQWGSQLWYGVRGFSTLS